MYINQVTFSTEQQLLNFHLSKSGVSIGMLNKEDFMLLCFDLNRVTYKDSGWYQATFFLRISSLKCRWHPLNAGELTQTLLFMNNYRGRHVCYYMLMNTHCTYCVPLYNILYIYIYIYIYIYTSIYIYV